VESLVIAESEVLAVDVDAESLHDAAKGAGI